MKLSGTVLLTRIIRYVFGALAGLLLLAAFAEVLLRGHLTFISPVSFGALLAVALAFMLHTFLSARERNEILAAQAQQLSQFATRLEASLRNAATINNRLNHSEIRYKGLVDAQGDAIFRRDAASRLTYGNTAFFKLFGLDPGRVIGYPFAPEHHPESRGPLVGLFMAPESGQNRSRYDSHVRTALGWRWIAWEDFAVRDAHGRLVEVQSVGRDVTERKALEQALMEAKNSAEAGSRAKSGFLATMSHEIRTPMNGVLGMARLLMETELSAEQRTYAHAINESGEALLALIGDILDFSKIESGMLTLEEDEVDLRQMIATVSDLLATRAHAKQVELISVIAANVPRVVRADGTRLRQIITNLIGNAVKFTEKGGVSLTVTEVMGEGRHFLRFEVRDTGVGVPPEKRAEIFEEFVQADSSHARKFGGTGLGLAISKRLAQAMGGEIGVDAATPLAGMGGSIFWFTIPSIVVQGPPAEQPLAGLCVAVMSPNRLLAQGLSAQIREAGGEVVGAAAARGDRVDVLLIDGGTEAEPQPVVAPQGAVPAVLLAAPAARSRLDALMEQGFAGYLLKPVRQAALVERLRDLHSTALQPVAPEQEPVQTEQPALLESWNVIASPEPELPPLVAQPAPAPQTALASLPHPMAHTASRPATSQGGLTILLAEDNPINMMLIRELLKRRGHNVVEVTTGTDAVKAMAERPFDLLLTDIHMPGMDGIEAARAIRTAEAATGRERVPIVALTADAMETGKRACQEAGMDGFLTKPVDPAELEEMFLMLFPSEDGPLIVAA
ncbi:MAG: response regulator [Alphaproteobacteria bacterium]|nr:response regulator [Alphaproteobacteria bacterium]